MECELIKINSIKDEALKKAAQMFKQTDVKIKIPALTGGKDPDEIIRTLGRDKFKGMLEGASNEIEFQLLKLRDTNNLTTTQGKIDFLNSAVRILAETTPIERDIYLTRLSNELSVDKASIKLQLEDYIRKSSRRRQKSADNAIVNNSIRENNRASSENNAAIRQLKAERRIIELLLMYPDCRRLCGDFDSGKFSSSFIKRVFEVIISRIDAGLGIDIADFGQFLTSDELGRLELLRGEGLVSAMRLLGEGPSLCWPHALAVVRRDLLGAAHRHFDDAWRGEVNLLV